MNCEVKDTARLPDRARKCSIASAWNFWYRYSWLKFVVEEDGELEEDGETLTLTLSGRKRSAIVVMSRDKSKSLKNRQADGSQKGPRKERYENTMATM